MPSECPYCDILQSPPPPPPKQYQLSVEAVISVTAHSPAEALQIARELVSKMINAAMVSPDAVSAYAHTHPTNRDDPVWKEMG